LDKLALCILSHPVGKWSAKAEKVIQLASKNHFKKITKNAVSISNSIFFGLGQKKSPDTVSEDL
jgi:hypothetical protein